MSIAERALPIFQGSDLPSQQIRLIAIRVRHGRATREGILRINRGHAFRRHTEMQTPLARMSGPGR